VYGVPPLLLATCSLAEHVPPGLVLASLVFVLIIGLIWIFAQQWLAGTLRITIYLFVPFAVYLSEISTHHWLSGPTRTFFNMLFGIFAVLILVISKFSRRTGGFKSSPMDFLIIILAVAVPNLPNNHLEEYQYGLVAAKTIMLYFSFEVLLAELRGRYNYISGTIILALLVLASR
jgi:UDP-GlcNAc:undecaprenyl-phosphate GlcNAc-1-phosphate transferase